MMITNRVILDQLFGSKFYDTMHGIYRFSNTKDDPSAFLMANHFYCLYSSEYRKLTKQRKPKRSKSIEKFIALSVKSNKLDL